MAARVYMAGPLGFFEAGRAWHYGVLLPTLTTRGWEPLDPWEAAHEIFTSFHPATGADQLALANSAVGRANEGMIRACDAVLAVLDGSDVDSGTAAEIGFAAALGTPVIGLRTDLRMSGDNAAASVNLQVIWFLENSGGAFVRSLDEAVEALASILSS